MTGMDCELIDDGPDPEAAAFDAWLGARADEHDAEVEAALDAILAATVPGGSLLIAGADLVTVECNICSATAEVDVDGDKVSAAPDGWEAWFARDGVLIAVCPSRWCQ